MEKLADRSNQDIPLTLGREGMWFMLPLNAFTECGYPLHGDRRHPIPGLG